MEPSEQQLRVTEDYSAFLSNESLRYVTGINDSLNVGNTTGVPQSRDEDLAKIEIAVLALIFSMTVLGNFIVLMGIYFRRQKMSRMYYFILHLSVADLITAFFNVLTQLIWELTWHFQGGNILCKFIKYAQILGPYSSSYVLVMTAVDRYQAICFPLSNCTWTARRSKLMLGFAWTLSILLCTPQLYIFSYMEVSPGVSDCWATFEEGWGAKAYVTWYAITVFIIPLVILTFAYFCICQAIWINFSMKNSIRRHQFSRSSRVSRDSETDNELAHTIVETSDHQQPGGIGIGIGNGGLHRASRASINNKAASYYNNLKGSENGKGNLPASWRNESNASPTAGQKSGRAGTMTLTTSFCQTPDDLKTMENHLRGSGNDPEEGGKTQFHPETKTQQLRSRFSTAPPHRHPDESDDENGMTPTCPSFQLASPQIDKIQIVPNGAKYSTPIPIPSEDNSFSKTKTNTNPVPLTTTTTRPSSKYKFPTNDSHSTSSPKNGKGNSKGKTYVWSSSRSSSRAKTKENLLTVSPGGGTAHSNSSSELKSKTNLKQLLLAPKKKKLNNCHSIVSRHEDESFRKNTITSLSFRQPPQPPRTSSIKGISRAKIKTIKLTVTVICCYVFCSSPFIAAQLWASYDPDAIKSPFWTGATFTILTLLASLNSCVNPWIFLFFNPNLLQDFLKGFGCSNLIPHKSNGAHGHGHSPNSATQRTNASPGLMAKASRRETGTSQLKNVMISSSTNMSVTPATTTTNMLRVTDASAAVA